MQFYFLNAKAVGDLTGLFLAQLDEQMGEKGRRFACRRFAGAQSICNGFTVDRGRLSIPNDDWFARGPGPPGRTVRPGGQEGMEIHPNAMRAATRDARLVDQVRDDPQRQRLVPGSADRATSRTWCCAG